MTTAPAKHKAALYKVMTNSPTAATVQPVVTAIAGDAYDSGVDDASGDIGDGADSPDDSARADWLASLGGWIAAIAATDPDDIDPGSVSDTADSIDNTSNAEGYVQACGANGLQWNAVPDGTACQQCLDQVDAGPFDASDDHPGWHPGCGCSCAADTDSSNDDSSTDDTSDRSFNFHRSKDTDMPTHRQTARGTEFRSTGTIVEARSASGGKGFDITVSPIRYGVGSDIADAYGMFKETCHRGCVSNPNGDIVLLQGHDATTVPYARTTGNPATMTTEDRSDGFYLHANVGDSPHSRDLMDAIQRQTITGVSQGFVVLNDAWNAAQDTRDIHSLEMVETSFTAFPAATGTTVQMAQRDRISADSTMHYRVAAIANELRQGKTISKKSAAVLVQALDHITAAAGHVSGLIPADYVQGDGTVATGSGTGTGSGSPGNAATGDGSGSRGRRFTAADLDADMRRAGRFYLKDLPFDMDELEDLL